MKLMSISVCEPFVRYKVDIRHFTSRHSTVIEWCILEIIKKAAQNHEYGEYSIDDLCSHIFKIDNSNLLVKPCIIELQGNLQAIEMDNVVYDNTDLTQFPAKNLSLTTAGLQMHEQGRLPGKDIVDTAKIIFNLKDRTFILNQSQNLSKEASGLKLYDIDMDIDNIPLPISEIKSFLQGLILQNKYLSPTTTINDIALSSNEDSYSVLWRNKKVQIELQKDMQIYVDGMNSEEKKIILDEILRYYDMNSEMKKNISNSNVKDVNSEYVSFISRNNIDSVLLKKIKENNSMILNKSFFEYDFEALFENEKDKPKAVIICGENCKDILVKKESLYSKNHLMVMLPYNYAILPDGVFFASRTYSLEVGNFELKADMYSRNAVLIAEPNTHNVNFKKIAEELVLSYKDKNNDLIYILPAFDCPELFLTIVKDKADKIEPLINKAEYLNEVIENTKRYFSNYKLIIDDAFTNKVFLSGNFFDVDYDEVLKRIQEIAQVSFFTKNENLKKEYLEKLLSSQKIYDLDKLFILLQNIEKLFGLSSWLKKNKYVQDLFNEDIIKSICTRCLDPNFENIPEYTDIEPLLKRFIKNIKNLVYIFKQISISLSDIPSKETIIKKLLDNPNIKINTVKETLKLYKENKNKINFTINQKLNLGKSSERDFFTEFFCEIAKIGKVFTKIESLNEAFLDALNFFFNDEILKYNKVYIIDTNALIDYPEIVDKFKDNKSALVIPIVVINELDKIKDDKNKEGLTERAKKSRLASKKIEYYSEKKAPWLIIGKSYPELLPSDIEKKKNDSLILSTALKYIEKMPIIITADKNAAIIAYSQKIKTIYAEDFLGINKRS